MISRPTDVDSKEVKVIEPNMSIANQKIEDVTHHGERFHEKLNKDLYM